MTAQAMVGSAFTAPHVTEWVTVDVTRTMELVERLKARPRVPRRQGHARCCVVAKALLLAIAAQPRDQRGLGRGAPRRSSSSTTSTSASPPRPRAGWSSRTSRTPTRMSLLELAEALGALDRDRPRGPDPAGRDGRRHDHDHQRRRLRRRRRHADPQPRRVGDPVLRRGPRAAVGASRARSRPRQVTQLALSLRPPARRRRARLAVPRRRRRASSRTRPAPSSGPDADAGARPTYAGRGPPAGARATASRPAPSSVPLPGRGGRPAVSASLRPHLGLGICSAIIRRNSQTRAACHPIVSSTSTGHQWAAASATAARGRPRGRRRPGRTRSTAPRPPPGRRGCGPAAGTPRGR